MSEQPVIYTIGHSNHSLERFLELVRRHEIGMLVDVRSQPYSRHVPHFNMHVMEKAARKAGLLYLHLGRELGGRRTEKELYDADGRLNVLRTIDSPLFRLGILRIEDLMRRYRLALVCAEENPLRCHRFHLVARALRARRIPVAHIRGDGRLQDQSELIAEARAAGQDDDQLDLF
ncbi:MAG: DUF488 domain-containing protein [Proteobacteria bacterium]|nr:DUF488 domain-containing protein [Pseudomonadota bacterium]